MLSQSEAPDFYIKENRQSVTTLPLCQLALQNDAVSDPPAKVLYDGQAQRKAIAAMSRLHKNSSPPSTSIFTK